MKTANDIVLKALGALLIVAGALKGWQLLTEPIADNSIWTWRPFMVLQVDFELALGIWLLSGLFKKAAWLATISCFSLFSAVTLYKGITGAESCGCFGSVDVNPWITLFAIDLPAVIALAIFRPKGEKLFSWPTLPRFATATSIGLITLGVTTPILAFNEPPKITSSYEMLEPETWVGKELPILDHIDIGKQLRKGNWLVLLYHHDCPDCAAAITKYQKMSRDITHDENPLRVAFVEMPPYGGSQITLDSASKSGKLDSFKKWIVMTPMVAILSEGKVLMAWEGQAPNLNVIYNIFSTYKG